MKFILRDKNEEIVDAWRREFAGVHDVEISHGDILELAADAIISPANSFGFMDGGIDLAYSIRFGWELQENLQAVLRSEHDGELPVGQALVVETNDPHIPFLVSAPTMRVPMDVSATVNAYLAFRAAIRAIRRHNRVESHSIESVLCPGLGTAVGRMHPGTCARQMHYAYAASHLGQVWQPRTLGQVQDAHYQMLR